jgi:NRPS condensation-like uncharacterized protein
MKKYSPVTSQDRQLFYRYKNVSDLSLSGVMYVDGDLNFEIIKQSVNLCLEYYPILSSKIVVGKFRLKWERRNDLAKFNICQLVEIENNETKIENEIQNFLLDSVAPWPNQLGEDTGPIVKVKLIKVLGSTLNILCLKSHHAASDAVGLKEVSYKMAEFYNKLLENPEYKLEAPLNYSRSMLEVIKKLKPLHFAGIVKRSFKEKKIADNIPRVKGFPVITGNTDDRMFLNYQISKEKFEKIKKYAKDRGATFNDMMNALFGYATLKEFGDGVGEPIIFYNPIDLRRYNPETYKREGPRNLSSCTVFDINPEPHLNFDDILAKCSHETKLLSKDMLGLGLIFEVAYRTFRTNFKLVNDLDVKWKKIVKFCENGGKLFLPIFLSNSGIIEDEKLIFGGSKAIDMYLIPPMYFHSLLFVFSSFQKQVTVSVGFSDANNTKLRIDRFYKIIDDEINRIIL